MNMKRLSLVFAVLLLAFTQHVHAQYYSVNYDARTVAAMAAAFGTEVVAESYYREQVDDILKHYTAAEVAAAGIFSSKFLEHKALSDLGIWCSSTETTITAVSTTWWPTRSYRKSGWWQSRCFTPRRQRYTGAAT